ncbi:MAG: CDC27 family protein [Bacteroidetes bacterium]|nr:CDC27 family protein [Bacteroidota bacterium]MBM3455633.1 tetratricopeptide repeat protein [Bacteroidota bacterium]
MAKISFLFFLFFSSALFAQNKTQLLEKAQDAYANKNYKDALFCYQKLDSLSGQKGDYAQELAQTLYRQNKFNEARNAYAKKKQGNRNSDVDYNIGNTFYRENRYEDAINSYREVLRKNPNDAEARHNLSLAMRKKSKKQKEAKNRNKEEKENNKDQKQKESARKGQQEKNRNQKDKGTENQDNTIESTKKNKQTPSEQKTEEYTNRDIERRKIEKMLENLAIKEMKTKSKLNNARRKSRGISKPW